MDNQKSSEGSGRNVGSEGSGSSMGKDLNKDAGITGRDAGSNNSGASAEMAKTSADLHKSIDKAAEAAQPVAERLASSAHAGVDKVSDALTTAGNRMDEKSKQLAEAYKHFADTGRDYVRSSPATSVLVALGAGFVLSKLLSRRH
jgi:ElaB/YqjD/DUF883 family membrane-anchored ribosome-binding protein